MISCSSALRTQPPESILLQSVHLTAGVRHYPVEAAKHLRSAKEPSIMRAPLAAVVFMTCFLSTMRAHAAAAQPSPDAFSTPTPVPAHEQLWNALYSGLGVQRDAVMSWVAAADSAAGRFLAGGRLWAGGPFPDFDGEACNRAGGLMAIAPLRQLGQSPADTLSARDVVLMGFNTPDTDAVRMVQKLRAHGVLVVGFGARATHPEAATHCDAWVDVATAQNTAGAPAAAILTIAQLWAFQGEFVAACLHRGHMPTIWQSIMMPGSQERNARYLPLRLHPDEVPSPVPTGSLSAAYLDSLRHYVRLFRMHEWGNLQMAARNIHTARQRDRTPYVCPLGGHLRPNRMAATETSPNLAELSRYIQPEALEDTLRAGDVLYIQGYIDPPGELLAAAVSAGSTTVVALGGRDGMVPDRNVADHVLDAQWQLGDAVVPLPGYDVPLLPPSGFMAAAVYWGLVLAAEELAE